MLARTLHTVITAPPPHLLDMHVADALVDFLFGRKCLKYSRSVLHLYFMYIHEIMCVKFMLSTVSACHVIDISYLNRSALSVLHVRQQNKTATCSRGISQYFCIFCGYEWRRFCVDRPIGYSLMWICGSIWMPASRELYLLVDVDPGLLF